MIDDIRKYALENFRENLNRLEKFLLYAKGKEIVAVFDIGTKACRILVGFKKVPITADEWVKENFFNDGQVFNLGNDFNLYNREIDIKKSNSLNGIIFFINTYKKILLKAGVSEKNMVAVGTAVFRWMRNRGEVLDIIRKATGLEVEVLKDQDEALLSSISVLHTFKFEISSDNKNSFSNNDVVLLFDQGGGSTEVSYFFPKNLSIGKLDSINELGTVALQDNFFSLNENERINPEFNRRRVSKQFERIRQFIDDKLDSWDEFSDLLNKGYKIHAFGMGTAISKCFKNGNNFSQNNLILSADKMNKILDDYCDDLDKNRGEVRTLYKIINEKTEFAKKIEKNLVLLYGLPVYTKLLKKFNLSELRYASFGLRYGLYIALFHYNLDLTNIVQEIPVIAYNRKKVFISYSWEEADNSEWVKNLSKVLRTQYGIDTEIDQYNYIGIDLLAFMEKSIEKADKVIVILTPSYKKKADSRSKGAGIEYHLILQEFKDMILNNTKFIFILRSGTEEESIPTFVRSALRINMVENELFNTNVEELVNTILDTPKNSIPELKK